MNDRAASVAIVHFQPIEKYPPAMNMVRFLDGQKIELNVLTQSPEFNTPIFQSGNAKILRLTNLNSKGFLRKIKYLLFLIKAIVALVRNRPKHILYYESLSAIPALFIKYLFPGIKVLAHYHEYTSPAEYKNGMWLNRKSFAIELKMIHRLHWISHTNADRVALFRKEFNLPNDLEIHTMANYPPKSWKAQDPRMRNAEEPIKMVYWGALGGPTMYIEELCDWVQEQKGRVLLHLISHQCGADVREYLLSLGSEWIHLHDGVDYNELPSLSGQYDLGVILYKGHIDNYVYNAPNKLFEYMGLGLKVWYPKTMIGISNFLKNTAIHTVRQVDFERLPTLGELEQFLSMDQGDTGKYIAEEEYQKILSYLQP